MTSNGYCFVHYSLASFKGFMVYNNYSCYIHHVEIQLNDVIKVSVGIGHCSPTDTNQYCQK